jgi:hypothetical protein
MKMIAILLLVLGLVFFGCTTTPQQTPIVCNAPYIQVGTTCCLDQNQNNVCDKDETIQQQNQVGCAYNNPLCESDYDCINNQCAKKTGCQYNNPPCGSNYNCQNNACVETAPSKQKPTITGVAFIPSKVLVNSVSGGGAYASFEGTLQVAVSDSSNPIKLIRNSDSIYCSGGVCNLPITNSNPLTYYTEGDSTSTTTVLCLDDSSNCQPVSVTHPSFTFYLNNHGIQGSTQHILVTNANSFEVSYLFFRVYNPNGSNIANDRYSFTTSNGAGFTSTGVGGFVGWDGSGFMTTQSMAPGEQRWFYISSNENLGDVNVVFSLGGKNNNFFSEMTDLYIEGTG